MASIYSSPSFALREVSWLVSLTCSACVVHAQTASAPLAAHTAAPALVRVAAPVAVPVAAPVTAPAPRQCLQAGLFTERQTSAMRARLQAGLPAGSWSFVTQKEPVRWIVYMGKYTSKAALKKKRAQLENADLEVDSPAR